MGRRAHPAILTIVALVSLGASAPAATRPATVPAAKRPPNIVIILADDAGYRDFGFQGSPEFRTPNIDRLARQGVVYDAAYASMPFCSPSRAGLLTGRYTQRFGYEYNLTMDAPPGVDRRFMGLAVEEKTIGDLFRAAGYHTIAVGKWHLGSDPQFHPNRRGFDDFYGFLGGGSTYFPEDVAPGTIERNGVAVRPASYLTDDFAAQAVRYIAANRDRPFLLYLAFNAVHTPMNAHLADEKRFAHIADPQRRRLAAMTWALDRGTGAVLDALRRYRLDGNTLVVFTNDNGGDKIGIGADNAPLRGTKGTLLEGGIRVPMIVRFPGMAGAGEHRHAVASLLDVVPTALGAARLPAPGGLDGSALRPVAEPDARPLFWRYDNAAAVRDGDWKLIRFPDRSPQLYNVGTDAGETRDLATSQPDRVSKMLAQLFAWEGRMEHPRWHTGSYWSQEDIRRYDPDHVRMENANERAKIDPSGAR